MTPTRSALSTPRLTGLMMTALLLTGSHAAASQPARLAPAMAVPSHTGCQISVGQSVVDYGSFTAGQLTFLEGRRYVLQPRTVPLTIHCPTPRPLALRVTAPTRNDGAARFAQAGELRVVLSHARIDGQDTRLINLDLPHLGPRTQVALRPGDVAVMEHGRSGRTFTAQIDLSPEVSDTDVRVYDQTEWSTTLLVELLDAERAAVR
ncbi:hypothetical protein [Achromobacter kerstersii]